MEGPTLLLVLSPRVIIRYTHPRRDTAKYATIVPQIASKLASSVLHAACIYALAIVLPLIMERCKNKLFIHMLVVVQ